jgi:anaerobic ribonucleoside-triphosphate reductase activating protein
MTIVALSRVHHPVTTLGPGRRAGVWFQGCSIRCSGCISPDTWEPGAGATSVRELLDVLARLASDSDGLTVSGGEPFDQPEALADLLTGWRMLSPASVLVFSGHPYERLTDWLELHDGLIDALLAGPFMKEKPQSLALRGSDNQTLHLLTPLGRENFASFDRPAEPADLRLDAMFDEDGGVWFSGIPARGDFDRLRQNLRAAGHQLTLTERTALR